MNKETTITLMKTTKGKTAGGYLHIPWQEGTEEGVCGKDSEAFLFSLDN